MAPDEVECCSLARILALRLADCVADDTLSTIHEVKAVHNSGDATGEHGSQQCHQVVDLMCSSLGNALSLGFIFYMGQTPSTGVKTQTILEVVGLELVVETRLSKIEMAVRERQRTVLAERSNSNVYTPAKAHARSNMRCNGRVPSPQPKRPQVHESVMVLVYIPPPSTGSQPGPVKLIIKHILSWHKYFHGRLCPHRSISTLRSLALTGCNG